eukprot:3093989-Rhodomonas_salina.1
MSGCLVSSMSSASFAPPAFPSTSSTVDPAGFTCCRLPASLRRRLLLLFLGPTQQHTTSFE